MRVCEDVIALSLGLRKWLVCDEVGKDVEEDVAAESGLTSSGWVMHIPSFSCAMHELMQACVRAIVRVAAQLSERACLADEVSSVALQDLC